MKVRQRVWVRRVTSIHHQFYLSLHLCRANMSDRKAVIKNADMSEEMQQDAVECATQALEKYNIEKDIAAYIKKVNAVFLGLSDVQLENRTSLFARVIFSTEDVLVNTPSRY